MSEPRVQVLNGASVGRDERGLRAWARSQGAPAGATHVSRSYSYPYAAVAWHDGPVGIDIERVEECDAEFAASICTPAERRAWAGAADVDGFFASVWCSKEALAKALGDALRYDPRRLETPIRWRHGTAGPWRARQLELAPRHVAWLCWRAEGC